MWQSFRSLYRHKTDHIHSFIIFVYYWHIILPDFRLPDYIFFWYVTLQYFFVSRIQVVPDVYDPSRRPRSNDEWVPPKVPLPVLRKTSDSPLFCLKSQSETRTSVITLISLLNFSPQIIISQKRWRSTRCDTRNLYTRGTSVPLLTDQDWNPFGFNPNPRTSVENGQLYPYEGPSSDPSPLMHERRKKEALRVHMGNKWRLYIHSCTS